MGVAAIEGVAAIDEVGVAAPGAVTGVDTGANEPLLLVSLKPRVTALKKIWLLKLCFYFLTLNNSIKNCVRLYIKYTGGSNTEHVHILDG